MRTLGLKVLHAMGHNTLLSFTIQTRTIQARVALEIHLAGLFVNRVVAHALAVHDFDAAGDEEAGEAVACGRVDGGVELSGGVVGGLEVEDGTGGGKGHEGGEGEKFHYVCKFGSLGSV